MNLDYNPVPIIATGHNAGVSPVLFCLNFCTLPSLRGRRSSRRSNPLVWTRLLCRPGLDMRYALLDQRRIAM